MVDFLEQAYVQRWWSYARVLYGESFREHCDRIIEQVSVDEGGELINWQEAKSRSSADEMHKSTSKVQIQQNDKELK